MMKLTIDGKEYKIKFGYNSFCDTDLMDRVATLSTLFSDNGAESDNDVASFGRLKELFSIVRELIYVGCKKCNPIESEEAVGDLLDIYMDEKPEGEERGLLHLFTDLSEELFNEGFLGDMTSETSTDMQNGAKAPQDHKKAQK